MIQLFQTINNAFCGFLHINSYLQGVIVLMCVNIIAVLGIRVDQSIATVFLLAGSLAGAAGILYGMKYNVFPTMGNIGLKAFVASVVGGLGSVPGAIVGSLLLGVLETFVSGYVSSSLRDFFSFALLIVLLLVKPSGLFGVDVQDKA